MLPIVEDYVQRGGTLVVNIVAAKELPAKLTGLKWTGQFTKAEQWSLGNAEAQATTPFEIARVDLQGAKAIAVAAGKAPLITRHQVGQGAVIVVLVPHGLGMDERAHPCLPVLMNAVTEDLL